jgi:hypothetical protein
MNRILFFAGMAALFCAADFITGRSLKPWWPTKSIYLTAPVVVIVLVIAATLAHKPVLPWAGLGVGWACWRSILGWSSFGGSMDPQTTSQILRELARNVVSSFFPMAALSFMGVSPAVAIVSMLVFAMLATVVAIWFGVENRKGHDVDPEVDALHGWLFGILAAAAIVWPR